MKKYKSIWLTSVFLFSLFLLVGMSNLNAQVVETPEEIEAVEEIVTEEIPAEETIVEEQIQEEVIQEEVVTEANEEILEEVEDVQTLEEEVITEEATETIEPTEMEEAMEAPAAPVDTLGTEIETIIPAPMLADPSEIDSSYIAPMVMDTVAIDSVSVVPVVIDSTAITPAVVPMTSYTQEKETEKVNYEWKEDKSQAIAIRAMGSTNGYGAEIVYKIIPRLSVRLGYETLNLTLNTTFDISEEEFETDIDYKVGAINAIADFYLAKGLYVAAGVGFNAFSPSADLMYAEEVTYGDLVFTPEDIGTLTLDFEATNKISPYLGLGFGRTIGAKGNVAFSVELGAYYQGPITIEATGTGLLQATAADEYDIEGDFEQAIDSYQWLPVLRFGLSFKLATFE